MRSSVMGRHGASHHYQNSYDRHDQEQQKHHRHRITHNNNNMPHLRQTGTTYMTNGHQPHRSSSTNELNDNNKYNPNTYDSQYEDDLEASGSYHQRKSSNPSMESRRELREKRERDFVPPFLLMDACITNNVRKVRDICRKLSTLAVEDVQPVANFQDQAGRTPLSYACCGTSILLIEELSRIRHIDSNLGDNDGNTPLHYASEAGNSEVVDLLIARFGTELDLNCRNSTGLTPLMKSAIQGRTRCAKSLLSAGASANLRDYSRGLTAAEWARLCGRHICSEVIRKDAHRHHSSSMMSLPSTNKPLPGSRSNMELKRINSDEPSYYHLYARSTISGANWLKNKIKRALGAGGGVNSPVRSLADKRPPISDGSYHLMGGATICAGSLLLPSIKPLIEQQRARQSVTNKKFPIPTLQVTPVKR